MAYVSCWRDGVVTVTKGQPVDALILAKGHGTRLKKIISAIARHSYDGKTLLVPGIPEAEDEVEAVRAAEHFRAQIDKRLAPKKPVEKTAGAA